MPKANIGVIGGTGLYEMEGLTDIREVKPKTPFGEPSDSIIIGTLDGIDVAFLPRHGRGHFVSPTEIPARANIYALKSLGVEWIISVSAVGSLKESIHPLDLVIPDQLIDRTSNRVSSFFTGGIVAHVGFARPFCPILSDILYKAALEERAKVHPEGTYVIMEGPLFSTKAESNLYRSWGASIIGMTALPEAKLAREAEICYATVGCVTDYDVWHETEEEVTVDIAISNLKLTSDISKRIIRKAVRCIPDKRDCQCASALKNAILTDPALIPSATKKDLSLLIRKYIQ
ncbi:MAG: S-methyl-5'-thioadenosine phosphorylase [Dehalococcoidia bacterium]